LSLLLQILRAVCSSCRFNDKSPDSRSVRKLDALPYLLLQGMAYMTSHTAPGPPHPPGPSGPQKGSKKGQKRVKNDPFWGGPGTPKKGQKRPKNGHFSGPRGAKSVKCYFLFGQKSEKSVFDKGGVPGGGPGGVPGGSFLTPFWDPFLDPLLWGPQAPCHLSKVSQVTNEVA
jgi:hypothetical protein